MGNHALLQSHIRKGSPDRLKLAAQNLTKRYGRRTLFRGLNIEASAGQPLCLWGPNGSGKSTLLKILAGLIRPSAGSVTMQLDGSALAPHAAKNHFGIAAPDVIMYDELTPLENLAFLVRMRGMPWDAAAARAHLAAFNIEAFADTPAGVFSSGMKQRLRLAAATLHKPDVLLLDEPTSYLDTDGAARVETILRDHFPRGLTVIATNDPRERAWCTAIVELGA